MANQGKISVIMAVPLPLVLLPCSPQQAPEILSKFFQIFQILLKQSIKGEHSATPTVFLLVHFAERQYTTAMAEITKIQFYFLFSNKSICCLFKKTLKETI